MGNVSVWFWAAGVLVALELATGTFYLLMIAVGLVCGGLVELAGGGLPAQGMVAGVTAALAALALRRSKLGRLDKTEATRDRNVNLDIGQTMEVARWQSDGAGRHWARAMYRGAMWDIDLAQDAVAKAGVFVIREVHGSRLLVANC